MFRFSLFLLFTLFLFSSCHRYPRVLEITHSRELKGVASASGIALHDENYFVVGDDSPFLYQVDSMFDVKHKWQIYQTDTTVYKIPSAEKPDFEAFENIGDSILLVLGSGSKSPQRDILVKIHPDNPELVESYSLSAFYAHLKTQKIPGKRDLNIEGLTVRKGILYLLNRTPAVIFEMNFNDFLDHVIEGSALPEIKSKRYKLPSINGTRAGFSGLTSLHYLPYLIFTASVEATDSATKDGAILGSFAGVIPLKDDQLTSGIRIMKLETRDNPVKVESVAVETIHADRHITIILVTDSDGRESMIYRCKMTW